GGCFFEAAAAEFDCKPGPIRDKVLEGRAFWNQSLARAASDAQSAGELQPDVPHRKDERRVRPREARDPRSPRANRDPVGCPPPRQLASDPSDSPDYPGSAK